MCEENIAGVGPVQLSQKYNTLVSVIRKIINQAGKKIALGAATLIFFTLFYGIASSFSSKKLLGSNPEFIVLSLFYWMKS